MTKKQKKVYRKRLRDQQRHLKTLAVATSVTTFGVGVTAAAEEVIPPVETDVATVKVEVARWSRSRGGR